MDGRGAEALFGAIASLGEHEQRLARTVTDLDSDQRLLLGDGVTGSDPEVRRLCHHLLERWDDLAVADRVASLVMLAELLAAGQD